MAWQKRHKVSNHTNRSDAWSTATVGNAERLVQVQVADVAAELARFGGANQGVHVGAVNVDPTPMLVDDLAQLFDIGLKHPVGAGIGDHHCCQPVAELLALLPQFDKIDVAVTVAADHHHLHACHLGTRGVGAVG